MKNISIINKIEESKNKIILIIIFSIAIAIIAMSLLRYEALNSTIADMGFFQSNLWVIKNEPARAFYGHFQPLYFLYGKLYNFLPEQFGAWFLLSTQGLIILLSSLILLKYFGWICSLLFILHPITWYIGVGDFHFDSLIILFNTIFFALTFNKRYGLAILICICFSFVKEFYVLQSIAGLLYIYIILYKEDYGLKYKLLIIISLLICTIYGYLINKYMLNVFIPDIVSNTFKFNNINNSFTQSVKSQDIFIKFKYIFLVLLPFSFLVFYKPYSLLLVLPNIVLILLINNKGYYSIANHYSSSIIIPVTIAFAHSYSYIKSKFVNIKIFTSILIIVAILSNIIFSPSPISRFFYSNKISKFNYRSYIINSRTEIIKDALKVYIPRSGNVSSQNSLNYYNLAHRKIFVPFDTSVNSPYKQIEFSKIDFTIYKKLLKDKNIKDYYESYFADFVVLDTKRNIYISDTGCDEEYGVCLNQDIESKFLKLIQSISQNYILIYYFDGFSIYQKK